MTDIKAEVERYAEGAIEDAHVLHQMMTVGDAGVADLEGEYGLDSSADWLDLLDVMALEVYGTKEVGPYRDDIVSITVITGTGGAHGEFEVNQHDRVTGRAYWSSDSAEKFDTMPGLFDALLPLVGGEE